MRVERAALDDLIKNVARLSSPVSVEFDPMRAHAAVGRQCFERRARAATGIQCQTLFRGKSDEAPQSLRFGLR